MMESEPSLIVNILNALQTEPKWISVIGLLLDMVGVFAISWGLIISKEKAVELGISRIAGNTIEENLTAPAVVDRLKQSKNAVIGLVLLLSGFALQIVGSWPR